MSYSLTAADIIDVDIEFYMAQAGEVFRAFRNQDSGCVSYGVLAQGRRWFVKHSEDPRGVASLRRAQYLHSNVGHRALPHLYHTFETPGELALVYEWVPGELLYYGRSVMERHHSHPAHPAVRFRALSTAKILDTLDTIYDVHLILADRGFIAVDFYDGCIIYDFEQSLTHLCDLDEYRVGPFVLEADRGLGSSRFMAPEEFQRGAMIDQITNVFTLGRTAILLLGDGTGSTASWRGTDESREVVVRATALDRAGRHQSVRGFVEEWRSAVGEGGAPGPLGASA